MEAGPITIDILCKVVDNYGDIGVVYRLARALSGLDPQPRLRLIVDKLDSFHALAPGIDPGKSIQDFRGWTVVRWEAPEEAQRPFRADPPRLVIESFACGRPDWFEGILFDPANLRERLIVNLEYLSAEDYADELHLLPSLTRSPLVKKRIFMPGFTPGTGGLVIDRQFRGLSRRFADPASRSAARQALARGWSLPEDLADRLWVGIFSYERDYSRVVADLAASSGRAPLIALVAAGRSQPCFLAAWEAAGRLFPAVALPFLAQEDWDEVLLACDFAIVRGEESWARAALSGRPFLWQAYPQASTQHLVKVRAFLDRIRPHFAAAAFAPLEALYLAFNERQADGPDVTGKERLLPILEARGALTPGFEAFAEALWAHGDLARHLLTFLGDFV